MLYYAETTVNTKKNIVWHSFITLLDFKCAEIELVCYLEIHTFVKKNSCNVEKQATCLELSRLMEIILS